MSMCVPSVYPSHGSSRTSLFFQALHSPEVAALAVTTRLSRGMPRGRRHAVARRVRLVGGKATRSNVVLTAPVAPRSAGTRSCRCSCPASMHYGNARARESRGGQQAGFSSDIASARLSTHTLQARGQESTRSPRIRQLRRPLAAYIPIPVPTIALDAEKK